MNTVFQCVRSVDVLLSLSIILCEICQFDKYRATLTLEVQELHNVAIFVAMQWFNSLSLPLLTSEL